MTSCAFDFECNGPAPRRNTRAKAGVHAGGVKKILRNARDLSPYLMMELLLPGGTLIALALWLSVNWRKMRQQSPRVP